MLGEQAWIVVAGQRVEPKVAAEHNYPFRFTDLEAALIDLLH